MEMPIQLGNIEHHIYTTLTQTKSKKFWAGFMKKADDHKVSGKFVYRVGRFDLRRRSKHKQLDNTMYMNKGSGRTTNPKDYILAFDLKKKSYRNISYARLLWFAVNKEVTLLTRIDTLNYKLTTFEKVKFKLLKDLLSAKIEPIKWSEHARRT